MDSKTLKTNSDLDKIFENTKNILNKFDTPDNFPIIYDSAKRFINQYGIGPRLIEKIYLLGYIEGVNKGSKPL